MSAVRQTWQVTLRGVRVLVRQPAYLGITLTQPIIWLLLFGALFKAVARIPGFHGGSYIDFLTPGVVVMLAISSAGWTGMGFIEDINGGVMDRMLVSPVWRGALNAGSVLYAVLTIVIQTVADRAARAGARRRLQGRRRRRAAARPRARRCSARLRLALERSRRARAPARDPDRRRQLRAAAAHVPLARAHAAEPRAAAGSRRSPSSTPSTGPSRPGARPRCRSIDWGLVGRASACSRRLPCCARGSPRAPSRATSAPCSGLEQLSLAYFRSGRRGARSEGGGRAARADPFFSFPSVCTVSIGAMRLLVVDDDPAVARSARAGARPQRLRGVTAARRSRGDPARSRSTRPTRSILDVLMPGLDGLEVCRRMRATGDRTPVLMLTARTEVSERVAGLEAGADDYLAKPFAHEELIARLRALLRRTGWEGDEGVLRFEDLELDPLAHEARRGGAAARAHPDRVPAARTAACATPARCSRAGRSSTTSGAMTSGRPRTRSRSTSATCAARPRPRARPAWCTRCGESATSCEARARDELPPPHGAARRRSRRRGGRARVGRRLRRDRATSCAGRSTRACAQTAGLRRCSCLRPASPPRARQAANGRQVPMPELGQP